MIGDLRPLDRLASIKTKLGALVAVTVVVAAVLATVGARAGWSAYVTVPVAVVAALAVTQLLARGMTSPLRQMTVAASAMAAGDYSRRVRATSRDEVGELARAFNRMAADLEAVDRQRRELVANVSHELRTPISALRAVLENVVDGVSRPDTATLRGALEQTERLGRLVTDLLDLSRVDAGVVPLTLSRVPLESFLRIAVAQAEMGDPPVDYTVDVAPPDLTVTGDTERLHQLVANLLDNAARHSPDGGEVSVRARLDQAGGPDPDGAAPRVVLEVVDQGPGIPVESRAAVFERFTSGDSAHADGGTGLGLAIARWVATLHGGSIAVVDSEAGCHIRVVIPQPRGAQA